IDEDVKQLETIGRPSNRRKDDLSVRTRLTVVTIDRALACTTSLRSLHLDRVPVHSLQCLKWTPALEELRLSHGFSVSATVFGGLKYVPKLKSLRMHRHWLVFGKAWH